MQNVLDSRGEIKAAAKEDATWQWAFCKKCDVFFVAVMASRFAKNKPAPRELCGHCAPVTKIVGAFK